MPDATPPPESAPASGATCLLVDCGFSELATSLVLSRHQLIEMYLVLAMIELKISSLSIKQLSLPNPLYSYYLQCI